MIYDYFAARSQYMKQSSGFIVIVKSVFNGKSHGVIWNFC